MKPLVISTEAPRLVVRLLQPLKSPHGLEWWAGFVGGFHEETAGWLVAHGHAERVGTEGEDDWKRVLAQYADMPPPPPPQQVLGDNVSRLDDVEAVAAPAAVEDAPKRGAKSPRR